jgi:hypothetical protein
VSRIRQGYKRHTIEVTSAPLRDGGFTVHFDIERDGGSHLDVTHFESGQRFKTDEDAVAAGLELGRHKVDAGYEVGTVVNNIR